MKSDPSGKNIALLSGHSMFLIVLYYSWRIISHELWFHNGKWGFLFSGKKEETMKICLHIKEVGQIWMSVFLWQRNSLWLRVKMKTLNKNLQIWKFVMRKILSPAWWFLFQCNAVFQGNLLKYTRDTNNGRHI